MTDFSLIIELDNAAFEDPSELSVILHKLSVAVDGATVNELVKLGRGNLRDSNGNTVGVYAISTRE